jgi:hypothetical protein
MTGGVATLTITGISAPDDVRRHIEDIHLFGDSIDFEEQEGALVLRFEQRGNTAALGALQTLVDGLEEALDPCTHPSKLNFSATASPVEEG